LRPTLLSRSLVSRLRSVRVVEAQELARGIPYRKSAWPAVPIRCQGVPAACRCAP